MSEMALECSRCSETKPVSAFPADRRNTRRGVSSYCKACHQASAVAWQKANPDRVNATRRARHAANRQSVNAKRKAGYDPGKAWVAGIRNRYGMTAEQYDELAAAQGGACAICQRPPKNRKLSVDHDHGCCPTAPTCGNCNRGLLCGPCNLAIHSMDVVPNWTGLASAYLATHKEQSK